MATLTPGQIFLADSREFTETDALQRFSSINPKHEIPAGIPVICDDNFIAAQNEITTKAPLNGFMVIMPITGALDVICGGELPLRVDVGEVHIRYAHGGDCCTLSNQYENDWINFVHIHLPFEPGKFANNEQSVYSFDLESNPDKLVPVADQSGLPFKLRIGMFGGRKEEVYRLQNEQSTLFAFVIAGAFEMHGRLLHQRDALALWQLPQADLEALSNNAVILVVEG